MVEFQESSLDLSTNLLVHPQQKIAIAIAISIRNCERPRTIYSYRCYSICRDVRLGSVAGRLVGEPYRCRYHLSWLKPKPQAPWWSSSNKVIRTR